MLRKLIRNKTIYAVASIVIGIVMVIKRGQVADDLVRIVGWIMLGMGVAYVASYFLSNDREQIQIGYAAAAVIGGLLLVILAPRIINLLPILAGSLLIINGITNLIGVNDESDVPAYSKGTAIAVIVLGLLIIIFSRTLINAAVLIMGICMILNGLAELDIIRRFW